MKAKRSALEQVEACWASLPPTLFWFLHWLAYVTVSATLYNPATFTRNLIDNRGFSQIFLGDQIARWYRQSGLSLFTPSRPTRAG